LAAVEAREARLRALEADFAPLGELRVARYEVTNAEYFAFCVGRTRAAKAAGDAAALERARALWPAEWTAMPNDPDLRRFPSGKGEHPVGGVSFRDAEEYCAWRSGELGVKVRLPTEAEWLKAAGAGDGRAYPWGATFDAARARYQRTNDGTVPVRTELGGQSPVDAHHMAGNVAEWVDTVWDDPAEGPDASSRVLKGGSYRSMTPENLALAARLRGGVRERRPEWGFRVVVEAE
ncbi:MAG: SUMF1/EgtB/PvdO family nonheme iron enzyme, partial [Planctomycetes bacterium]|nr:SUMF1/EgtB/PvdO family nonheme iron enzyme [Planctomycetota bacterium]